MGMFVPVPVMIEACGHLGAYVILDDATFKGMTCTSCSNTVESVLRGINGVRKAQVALATEEAEIHYDPSLVNYKRLLQAVEDAGFELGTCIFRLLRPISCYVGCYVNMDVLIALGNNTAYFYSAKLCI